MDEGPSTNAVPSSTAPLRVALLGERRNPLGGVFGCSDRGQPDVQAIEGSIESHVLDRIEGIATEAQHCRTYCSEAGHHEIDCDIEFCPGNDPRNHPEAERLIGGDPASGHHRNPSAALCGITRWRTAVIIIGHNPTLISGGAKGGVVDGDCDIARRHQPESSR